MKTRIIALFAGLLAVLPMTSAWAGGGSSTTYYAALKTQVSSTGGGKVYAGTSNSAGAYAAMSTSGSQNSTTKDASKTFYAFAQADTGFEFAGWSNTDGGTVVSTVNPYSVPVKCSSSSSGSPTTTTVWANFKKKELPSFTVSFLSPVNGSYTVDGENPPFTTDSMTVAYTPELVATPAEGYVFKNWYTMTDDGETHTPFSTTSKCTGNFVSKVSVGVEFVQVVAVSTYGELTAALQAGESVLSLGADMEIPFDGQVTIPKDTWLIIADGKMLTAKGKLVNNGKISGGSIAHSYITVVQDKTVRVPWEDGTDGPEGTASGAFLTDGTSGKYLVTSLKNEDSLSGSGTYDNVNKDKVFATINNQASGEKFASKISTTKPKAVLCTVAREKAANWIDGVVELGATVTQGSDTSKEVYTTFGYALEACGYSGYSDSNKMIVLLQDVTDGYKAWEDGTNSGTSSKMNAAQPRGAVDCASKKLTITSGGDKINSGALIKIFNCANDSKTALFAKKALTVTASFYNCGGSIIICGSGYATQYCFYDSPNIKISYNSGNAVATTSKENTLNFYGGDYCTTAYSQDLYNNTKEKYAVVYSGRYKSSLNPGDNLCSKTKYEVVPVEGSSTDVKVVKKFDPADAQITVDGEPSTLTFQAALDVASDSKLTVIALKKDLDLASDLVVPKGKKVRIDVYERKLTGGFKIINNGELEIIDMSGSSDIGQVGVAIENNGELLLCDAIYNGSITLNGGKCYFVDGQFNGDIIVSGDVADAKSVAEVGGGSYAKTTYAHSGATGNLKDLCVDRGYVTGSAPAYLIANIPKAEVKYNSSAAKFEARAFDADSTILYEKRNLRDECTKEEWIAVRRLQASAEMFGTWSVDCAVIFDRFVPLAGFNITLSGYSALGALDSHAEVAANSSYSAFLQALRYAPLGPYAPLRYSEFLPGGTHEKDLDMTVGCTASTRGTSCDMEMRIANGVSTTSGPKDYSYTTWVVLGTCRFVFGAGTNKAMLQPAEGEATFYSTLATAVAAAETNGKTIKLCNDCNEQVIVGKACTIDTNGFVFEGKVNAASGFAVSEEPDGKYVVSKVTEVEVETTDSTGTDVSITIVPSEELVEQVKAEVGDGATPEQIAEEVGKKMQETSPATGLKGWQEETLKEAGVNVTGTVVGSGNGAIKNTAAADGATSQNDVKVTYDLTIGGTTDAGKAVAGVSLAKVVVADSGEKTYDEVNGAKSDTKVLAQNFAELEAGVYQPMIVIEVVSKDDKKAELSIPNPHADRIVVQKPRCKAGEPKIIAVPGGMIGQGEMVSIDKVIDTSALKDGDKVTFYNKKTQGYESWTYAGGWTSDFNANSSASGESPAADTVNVPAGSAIWFTASSDKPVTIVAQQKKGIATKVDSDGWNLLANPMSNSVNLNDVIPEGEAKAGDQIVLPLEGADGAYQGQVNLVKKDGKWGRYKAEISGGRMTMVWSTEDAVVGPGAGVWFISNGGKPTFQWGNSEQAE